MTIKAATRGSEREGEGGGEWLLKQLVTLSSEVNTKLERIEQRLSVNEHRVLTEEARVTTLVKSTQEIEGGILEGQRQLLSRKEEQESRLEEFREKLHQLERRQLQLGEFGRQAQDAIALQVQRVGEGLQMLKSHVETTSGSFGGKINALAQQCKHQVTHAYLYMYMCCVQCTVSIYIIMHLGRQFTGYKGCSSWIGICKYRDEETNRFEVSSVTIHVHNIIHTVI